MGLERHGADAARAAKRLDQNARGTLVLTQNLALPLFTNAAVACFPRRYGPAVQPTMHEARLVACDVVLSGIHE